MNEPLRQERLAALTDAAEQQREAVRPILDNPEVRNRLQAAKLYHKSKVCSTCHNGKNKRRGCSTCQGQGKYESFVFNLGSEKQLKDVLYNGLKLPKRTQDGKLVSDEEALQSLVALDTSGFVLAALKFAKYDTLSEIYERIAPAPDGHNRTVYNPAGAYNGRFSSAGAFYVPFSTNQQNMPNEALAQRNPLYNVRECFVPDPGEVFLYADLSAADQWSVAAYSKDERYFEYLKEGRAHKVMAAHLFDKPESEIQKGSVEYFVAKTANHAVCFGEGPNRLWRGINKDADVTGFAITLADAKVKHRKVHEFRPNLDTVWWNRVEQILRGDAVLTNAWGRTCRFYPRIDWQTGEPDQETLRAMMAWGPASNTVDTLNHGMLELFFHEAGNGFRLLFQGHDSVLLGVDKHRVRHVARLCKAHLERPITVNGYEFVIPVEVHIAPQDWGHMERVI